MSVSAVFTRETLIPVGLSVGIGMGLYYVGLSKGQIETRIERNEEKIASLSARVEDEKRERLAMSQQIWAVLRDVQDRTARIEGLLRTALDEPRNKP